MEGAEATPEAGRPQLQSLCKGNTACTRKEGHNEGLAAHLSHTSRKSAKLGIKVSLSP
jgi:hypothetical protein